MGYKQGDNPPYIVHKDQATFYDGINIERPIADGEHAA